MNPNELREDFKHRPSRPDVRTSEEKRERLRSGNDGTHITPPRSEENIREEQEMVERRFRDRRDENGRVKR